MKNLFIIITFLLAASSCGEKGQNPSKLDDLSFDEIQEIAKMHNTLLDKGMPKINGRVSSLELKQSFLSIEIADISRQEKEKILNDVEKFDLKFLEDNIDSKSFQYILRANTILNENNTLDEITEALGLLYTEVESSNINNKTAVLLYCATATKSAEYWLPVDKGGNGLGYGRLKSQRRNGRVLSTGKEIMAADALSLSAAFTGAGLLGWAGGPAGFFATVAFAGAFGSAAEALQ